MSKSRQKTIPPLAYGLLTPLYDSANNAMGFGRALLRRVAVLVDPKKDERLLDIACGTGTLLRELLALRPGLQAVGLEPDLQALAIARAKVAAFGNQVALVHGVGQRLPFADATMDVVTCTMAFHHMPTPVKRLTVAEAHRVLKEGGRFVLVDFGRPGNMAAAILLNLGSLFDGRENMRANLRGEILWMLSECGFSVSEAAPPFRGVRFLRATKLRSRARARPLDTSSPDAPERPACCGPILTSP